MAPISRFGSVATKTLAKRAPRPGTATTTWRCLGMTHPSAREANSAPPLFPPLEPYHRDMLQRGPLHRLYYEESGNPDGVPMLFVHGGPGGASQPDDRRFFDPEYWRIILFDQRGCGHSRPHSSLQDNDLPHLLDDIDALRQHLAIESWALFGGSWGSALALAYAQTAPAHVRGLILHGIFLARRAELDWFFGGGAADIYPDAWAAFVGAMPEAERGDIIAAYYRRLTGSDTAARAGAADAWARWEAQVSSLKPDPALIAQFTDPASADAMARIEAHFWTHGAFLNTDDQLLRHVAKIRHIPGILAQGRHDAVCPMRTAWTLHQAWPEADFRIVPNAAHSPHETAMAGALVTATNDMARRLRTTQAKPNRRHSSTI